MQSPVRVRPALVALVVAVVSACGNEPAVGGPGATELYTLNPGGLITAETVPGQRVYALEGQPGSVHIEEFIGGGVAQVGDVILPVAGHPTWAYTARALDPKCWLAPGSARLDGSYVDLTTPPVSTKPNVEVHVRVPRSSDFVPDADADGHLVGSALCVNRAGLAASYH